MSGSSLRFRECDELVKQGEEKADSALDGEDVAQESEESWVLPEASTSESQSIMLVHDSEVIMSSHGGCRLVQRMHEKL